jgi:hypothetical protein
MMALFKNLYLDFSYLNPLKKSKSQKKEIKQPPVIALRQETSHQGDPQKKMRELPAISKRLLGDEKYIDKAEHAKTEQKTENAVKEEEKKHMKMPFKELKAPMMPPSIKQADEQKTETFSNAPVISVEKTETKIQNPAGQAPVITADEFKQSSFFSRLYSHLSSEENALHNAGYNKILGNNLFEEMQDFWHERKEELSKTAFNRALKTDLMKKMSELQNLEIEWQKLQLQEEKLKDELSSKEMVIENNVRHLKKSFRKLHLNLEIKPEHYFVLADGKKLKNLQELYENVKYFDKSIFSVHVNESKNDFSTWVKDIMGLNELSSAMKEAKTREEIYHSIDDWYNKG